MKSESGQIVVPSNSSPPLRLKSRLPTTTQSVPIVTDGPPRPRLIPTTNVSRSPSPAMLCRPSARAHAEGPLLSRAGATGVLAIEMSHPSAQIQQNLIRGKFFPRLWWVAGKGLRVRGNATARRKKSGKSICGSTRSRWERSFSNACLDLWSHAPRPYLQGRVVSSSARLVAHDKNIRLRGREKIFQRTVARGPPR